SKALELLLKVAEKNAQKKTGKRFDAEIKLFSTYLYLTGGCLLYETLYNNFKASLPSLSTIRQNLQNDYNLCEGKLRFIELKEYLLKHNYPLDVWISEDATAITGRIQYDSKTDSIIGFPLPLTSSTGLPVVGHYEATNAKRIYQIFSTEDKCKYAYVVMAQPLAPNAAPFCICAFGTNNKFKYSDIRNRWRTMKNMAREHGIQILGFSGDGDSRILKAMRYETIIPISNDFNTWFQINPDIFESCYIQDTVHIGTKLKTRLLNQRTDLRIGKYTANVSHLHHLVENVTKDKHLLTKSHLNSDDKMNFESVERIIDEKVQRGLQDNVADSQGTVAFLKIMAMFLDAFLEKQIDIETRISNAWFVVFFLRIWRHWIKSNGFSLDKNFITLNAYICVELNAHALVLMTLRCHYLKRPELLMPWLMSSQPCEKTFRATRSMTSTFSTIVNFSMLDILHRLHRIQILNDVMCDLKDEIIFPREHNRRMGSVQENHMMEYRNSTIDYDQINIIIEDAKEKAIGYCGLLGIPSLNEEWMNISIPNVQSQEKNLSHNLNETPGRKNNLGNDTMMDDMEDDQNILNDMEDDQNMLNMDSDTNRETNTFSGKQQYTHM
ncbi:unnamed protein product, partial [Phaedon cochleariae]